MVINSEKKVKIFKYGLVVSIGFFLYTLYDLKQYLSIDKTYIIPGKKGVLVIIGVGLILFFLYAIIFTPKIYAEEGLR